MAAREFRDLPGVVGRSRAKCLCFRRLAQSGPAGGLERRDASNVIETAAAGVAGSRVARFNRASNPKENS